jgi:hypothetical protein
MTTPTDRRAPAVHPVPARAHTGRSPSLDRAWGDAARMATLWERARPLLPTTPAVGSPPEYRQLQREWRLLRRGLPRVDGWTVTCDLPDPDDVGEALTQAWILGESLEDAAGDVQRPGRQLLEYCSRLALAEAAGTTAVTSGSTVVELRAAPAT